ncbi:carbamoyl-phosphate synthase large subunit [Klenkia soli]|uniref:Carbamoyl-phosphate synthase large subunit n=1 Tax=Klenkia soli TaxID=1052260 RepID=A0A1H0BY47_9ACTN|nr:ATP-grasp domain-containing protein [Klenkia soli]SDN50611.1 carbamoyl-phosphate synthase large subunit [Klenkia soli]
MTLTPTRLPAVPTAQDLLTVASARVDPGSGTVVRQVAAPTPPPPSPRPRGGGAARRPAVLVTGSGGPAGVAVIRRLRALGHRVVAVDADPSAAGGALADVGVTVPRADHPSFVDALVAAAAEHDADALVPTVAEELVALRSAAHWLASAGLHTWLPDAATVDICCDKDLFARHMAAARVPHPAAAGSPAELAVVPGPWVVKPRRGRGSRGVQLLDDAAAVRAAMLADPELVAQTRLTGREFTADALVSRDGELLTAVPRWREETKAGISVKGSTFASAEVTALVAATLAAVRLTGPANVQGFVADDGTVTVMEVNPRFSGGLPLTLAAGADVVGTYLQGIREPHARLPQLFFTPGVRMSRYFAETYSGPDGRPVGDPCAAPAAVRA